MIFPTTLSINVEEAAILEMSLRGEYLELRHHRELLRQIGQCLVDESDGKINIYSEDDLWFLRDKIDPGITVGESSGLYLITKLYKIILGVKLDYNDIITPGEGGEVDKCGDEDEAKDANEDRTSDRPKEKIES